MRTASLWLIARPIKYKRTQSITSYTDLESLYMSNYITFARSKSFIINAHVLVLNKKRQEFWLLLSFSFKIDLKTNSWQFVSCKPHTYQWNINHKRINETQTTHVSMKHKPHTSQWNTNHTCIPIKVSLKT